MLSQFDPGNSTACEGNNGPGVDGVVGLPCLSARQKVSCRTWAWRYDAAAVKNRDSHYHTTRGGGGRINPALDQRRHEIKVKKGVVPGSLTYSLLPCVDFDLFPPRRMCVLSTYVYTYLLKSTVMTLYLYPSRSSIYRRSALYTCDDQPGITK